MKRKIPILTIMFIMAVFGFSHINTWEGAVLVILSTLIAASSFLSENKKDPNSKRNDIIACIFAFLFVISAIFVTILLS